MPDLFIRDSELIFYKPLAGSTTFKTQANGVSIKGLRVSFNVVQDLKKNPDSGIVTVINLSPDLRALAESDNLKIKLRVGYREIGLQEIFSGDVLWSQSKKNGTEWVTEFHLADGGRAHSHARVNRSFKAGASAETIAKDIANSMGLKLPTDLSSVELLESAIFQSGVSLEGKAWAAMDKLTGKLGTGWIQQNGRIKLVTKGAFARQAAVVDQASGLLGVPAFSPPENKSKKRILTFKSLIDPRLVPGYSVSLSSVAVSGMFKVTKATQNGDTRGSAWYTTVEATPL